jgi:predicted aspartyl protease
MRHHLGFPTAIVLAVFLPLRLLAQPNQDLLPIKLDRARRIIVQGTIDQEHFVNMMIDTGATCSVVSTKLAARLQLRTLLDNAAIIWIDQLVRRSVVVVPDIQLGPIHRALSCAAADIPLPGIDMIIGRDILRTLCFTVDYRGKTLLFGAGAPLKYSVSFDPSRKEIIVPVCIGRREIALLLDSGADRVYLFEHRMYPWLKISPESTGNLLRHVSTARHAMNTTLPNIRLGNAELESLEAAIIESLPGGASRPLEWHGLLGLAALKAKRVRFDLKNGLFSWER